MHYGILMPVTASDEPYIRLEVVSDLKLSRIKPLKKPAVFLEVSGADSKNIVLYAKRPQIKLTDGVGKKAVRIKRQSK
jgi:hypothetical protein